MKKAVCIMSGGMDSALCAFMAKSQGFDVIALHFNYGQRTEKKELESFHKIADIIEAKKIILNTHFIEQIGGNSLTDSSLTIQTEGLKNEIPNTYVPYRNGIFLSIAASLAEKEEAETLFIGVVEEDSSGYPDCSETFIRDIEKAVNSGTKKETKLAIKTPLVHLSKKEIVKKALEFGVPLEYTWSCYKNENKACGVCDSCRLRLKGFEFAGVKDKIIYES